MQANGTLLPRRAGPGDGRLTVALYHLRTCPVRWSTWSERAADDYVRAVLIMGGMILADLGHAVSGKLQTGCAHPDGLAPDAGAQLLVLTTDEPGFRAIANRTAT